MQSDPATRDIAVIGAAGLTGRAVVDVLRRSGRPVRALVRNMPASPCFASDVSVRMVDLGSRTSLAAALDGAAAAYYVPPRFCATEEIYALNLIAALERTKVRRLVYHSVLHAPTPAMPHHWRKSQVEAHIRESHLEWTILQPAMYVQTALLFLDRAAGTLEPGFDVARPFNAVDLLDLAQAAAEILEKPGHEYATYELAGAERLAFIDMATIIAGVVGRAVQAVAVDADALADRLTAHFSFNNGQREDLRRMLDHYNRHGLPGNCKVLRMLLGRPLTSFADTAARELT